MKDSVTLRRGKDKALRRRHPWIFSGAIAKGAEKAKGERLPVFDADGKQLATAYFNHRSSICGRVIAWGDADPHETLRQNIRNAVEWRQQLFGGTTTNGYRLINGEGDGIPGLVVDRYDDTLVIQISTRGIVLLRDKIVETLCEVTGLSMVYEKSTMTSRKEEGLKPAFGWIKGEGRAVVPFMEEGIHYLADIVDGQKTGFFLDQRSMRGWIRDIAKDHTVLNCFSYSGAFSLSALTGGATQVTSVDVSEGALSILEKHLNSNTVAANLHTSIQDDVFEFLRKDTNTYSMIILDPPAFVKKRKDVMAACRGYKDINRLAFQRLKPGGLLLTCSCSHHVEDELFQKVVFQAALESKCNAQIIGRHRQAPDHPVSIYHPEGHYLKSLLVRKG